jgi:hypothetical protein
MNDEAVTVSIVSILPILHVGDYMKYSDGTHKEGLGKVVHITTSAELFVKKFSLLSSKVLQKYSLCQLSAVH